MLRRCLAVLSLALLLTIGCANHSNPPNQTGQVNLWHIVVIRLNHPRDAQDQQKVIDASRGLQRDIPVIQSLYVGKVLPGDRPHQDSSFDVAIVMGFKSKEDMAAYVAHPAHVKAVNEVLKPLAKDYTSYDFTNE
jgi:hypothetical protein